MNPTTFRFFTKRMFGVVVLGRTISTNKKGVVVEGHHHGAEWRESIPWGTEVYKDGCTNAELAAFKLTKS